MRRRPAGRSKFEFSIALLVILIVGAVLLDRLLRLEESAERLAVELTVRNMRTGMQYRQADLIVRGRDAEMASLLASNPVSWLERPPEGYIGARAQLDPAQLAAGEWAFSSSDRRLYYRPRLRRFLRVQDDGELLAWRVSGTATATPFRPGALQLALETPYLWSP